MKRLFIVLIGLWAVGTAFAQTANETADLSEAVNTVKSFYDGLAVIAEDPESDPVIDAFYKCIDLLESGILLSFPDESQGIHDELRPAISGEFFVSSFRRHQMNQPFTFSYSIQKAVPYYGPTWTEGEPISFVYVLVDKNYSDRFLRDTVLVNNKKHKIVGIRNQAGGNAYTSYFNASPNEKSLAENPGSQTKMYTCRVQIYFDDGSVLNESKITVYWTKGGFFSTEHEGTFYTDKKGWVTISWPADEAEEIKDIYFSTGFIFMTHYHMTNLSLKDGKTYRLNADSFD